MPSTSMIVDLRSDTVTQPTPCMREAMARAEVGDDVLGEDPSVNELQRKAAALAGKEAALFVPTGTMANLLAVLAQTRPGDAIVMHEDAHPFNYESANLAMVAGVLVRTAPGAYGLMGAVDVDARIAKTTDHHVAPTTLVEIENTTNRGGGAIYPLATVAEIAAVTHRQGLRMHCDGARIFNASVASGVSVAEYAAQVDTLSFCLSKGLGCPVGSLLCGAADVIDRAHRFRKMLGGGMRQAGVLAAAGIYALDHHVNRLAEDHRRARRFREALEGVKGVAFPLPSPTNIVFIDVADAPALAARLRERGVLISATAPTRLRAVFHLDVDDEHLNFAIEAIRSAL